MKQIIVRCNNEKDAGECHAIPTGTVMLFQMKTGISNSSCKLLGVTSSFNGLFCFCDLQLQDASLTARARDTAPISLCDPLLTAALQMDCKGSVEQLVARWPWKHLFFRNYVPPMFGPRVPPCCHRVPSNGSNVELCKHVVRAVKQTIWLVQTFMKCLRRNTGTKLQYLDLTGYPSG